MTDDPEQTVRLESTAGVVTILLSRPERLNALSPRMAAEFAAALDQAADARALVLTGEGRAFSSGWDLSTAGDPPGEHTWDVLNERLAALPIPTIAAIEGWCLGGGTALALACDLRVAASSATLGLPEMTRGFFAGMGCAWRLTQLLGPARAKRIMFLGDHIPATQAEQWGLVDYVTDEAGALAEAQRLAARLAAGPPLGLRAAKALIDEASVASLAESLAAEAKYGAEVTASADSAEGIKAFLEKRAPNFKGA